MNKTINTIAWIIGFILGVMITFQIGAADHARAPYVWEYIVWIPITAAVYVAALDVWKTEGWKIVGLVIDTLFILIIWRYFVLIIYLIARPIFKILKFLF